MILWIVSLNLQKCNSGHFKAMTMHLSGISFKFIIKSKWIMAELQYLLYCLLLAVESEPVTLFLHVSKLHVKLQRTLEILFGTIIIHWCNRNKNSLLYSVHWSSGIYESAVIWMSLQDAEIYRNSKKKG